MSLSRAPEVLGWEFFTSRRLLARLKASPVSLGARVLEVEGAPLLRMVGPSKRLLKRSVEGFTWMLAVAFWETASFSSKLDFLRHQ